MHGEADYSRLWVKLYEDIVQFDEITISHRYPTRINGHYVIDPEPDPALGRAEAAPGRALTCSAPGARRRFTPCRRTPTRCR